MRYRRLKKCGVLKTAKLYSVFTKDLYTCYLTKSNITHRHHIFGGANKARSEKYGFIIPLRPDLHNMSNQGVHFNKDLDLKFKRMAQEYYEEHFGTRKQFIKEFGRNYLN